MLVTEGKSISGKAIKKETVFIVPIFEKPFIKI